MTISELIKHLKSLREQYGEVWVEGIDGVLLDATAIEPVQENHEVVAIRFTE